MSETVGSNDGIFQGTFLCGAIFLEAKYVVMLIFCQQPYRILEFAVFVSWFDIILYHITCQKFI